jgi:hypothetical protein
MAALPPNDPNNNPHLQNEINSGKAVVRFEAGGQTEKAARLQSTVHARRCGTPEPSAKYYSNVPGVDFSLAPGGDERRVYKSSTVAYPLYTSSFYLGPGPYKN